jgi:hypothetical protein
VVSSDYLHAPFLDPAVYLEALRLLVGLPRFDGRGWWLVRLRPAELM